MFVYENAKNTQLLSALNQDNHDYLIIMIMIIK